jgi:RNA polymerase sigma-70 factor (family 1)
MPRSVSTRSVDAERELIAAIRLGDYAAFDRLFRDYVDRLCAYACNLLRSSDEARDVVQDLFLWIWQHRAQWSVPGTLKTYLYQATHNRAIDRLRHRNVERAFRNTHADDPDIVPRIVRPVAHERLEAADLALLARRAIAGLPPRCRQVFVLKQQHGLTYAQIAEVMQLSPKTVENHLARALAGMRAQLEEWVR